MFGALATLAVADFDALKEATVSQVRDNVNDKSRAGKVDDDVVPLVDTVNALRDFYTTSSCAGRLILVQSCAADTSRKYDVDWLAVTHDCAVTAETHIETFWRALTTQLTCAPGFEVTFKMEAPIVAVCARDIHCAEAMAGVCRIAGVKRSAITSLHEKIIISIADTRKIEMLVALDGRVLVEREYFGIAVRHALAKLIAARQRLLQRFRRECVRRLPLIDGALLPATGADGAADDGSDDDAEPTAAPRVSTTSAGAQSSDTLYLLQIPLGSSSDAARRALQSVEFTHPELSCTGAAPHFFIPLSGAVAAKDAVAHLRRECPAMFEAADDVAVVHSVPRSRVSMTQQQSSVTEPQALVFRSRRALTQTARELVIARLQRMCTSALIEWESLVPLKWEKFGSVLVLTEWPTLDAMRHATTRPLSTSLAATALNALAEALMHHLLVTAVCVDSVGIGGELRQPDVRVVGVVGRNLFVGADADADVRLESVAPPRTDESPTLTVHVENGIQYSFDVRLCMFASGNGTERMHFAAVQAPGERVVDMFAGIGYFTLPLAKHGRVERIVCLEKNPDSVAFLRRNAALNNVEPLLTVLCGDNRIVGDEYLGTADRVLMGYLPTPFDFVARAIAFLKAAGGIVHFHYICRTDERFSLPRGAFAPHCGTFSIDRVRFVKHYAPHVDHFVADIRISSS